MKRIWKIILMILLIGFIITSTFVLATDTLERLKNYWL